MNAVECARKGTILCGLHVKCTLHLSTTLKTEFPPNTIRERVTLLLYTTKSTINMKES